MSLTALVTLRLLQPSAEAIAPSFTTLAVLPFGTQSSQDSLASSAVGLSQDLLLRLQSLGSIQCVSRGQILATAYPGTPRRLIARQVGAEVMILGEVRRLAHGLGLRLNIEDARTGRVLAELDLTASTERIFDLQRRATREVLAVLGMPVSTSERSRLDEDPTRSLKAWDYFTHGQVYLEDLTNPRGPVFAADLFRRALQLDPDFHRAEVALSEALWLGHLHLDAPPDLTDIELVARRAVGVRSPSAAAAVVLAKILLSKPPGSEGRRFPPKEILQLDKPDEALREVASGMWQVGRLEATESALRAAVQEGGDFWLNSFALAQFLERGGRFGEAAAAFQIAVDQSPAPALWPRERLTHLQLAAGQLERAIRTFGSLEQEGAALDTTHQIAVAHAILGRVGEAERLYRACLELAPRNADLYRELADLLLHEQRPAEATQLYGKALELLQSRFVEGIEDPTQELRVALLAARTGDCPGAVSVASRLVRLTELRVGDLHDLALILVLCDQQDRALEVLLSALISGLPAEIVLSRPEFESLATHPEFQSLAQASQDPPPSP